MFCLHHPRALLLVAALAGTMPTLLPAQTRSVTAELRKLLAADQDVPYPDNVPTDSAARVAFFTAEWNKHFKPRQDRVVAIVRDGLLRTGEDYFIAGTIFNHGMKPEDNLMAHSLLLVAAMKGYPDALWESAAALDNYLASIGKAQLFGTVYGEDRSIMGEPMTDALRREFCVPPVAKQKQLAEYLRTNRRRAFDREKVSCPPGKK
jgi:hypothetical protein